jgi:hypothetical protein
VVIPAAGTKPVGTLLMWQLSHAAVVGKCAGESLLMVVGYTPTKLLGVTAEPWQLAQLCVMPL